MKLLTVGTGRSGTGYVAEVLTRAGLGQHSGHEAVFGPSGPRLHLWHWFAAESSWLAVPFLEWVPEDVTIVHVWRDPKKVVDSFTKRRFFTEPSAYREFWTWHTSLTLDASPRVLAEQHVDLWSEQCEQYAHHRFRIDEIDWRVYAKALGLDPTQLEVAADSVPHTWNT